MRPRSLQTFLVVAATGVALFALAPHLAHANFFEDIAYSVIGKVVFGISYVVSIIAGVAVAMESWLVGLLLQLNTQIVESTPVKIGFSVALSIANLGFVLGIIVIALATILRRQTYGVKQILWKLVTAAILVNFSLTIAGTILSFSDQLAGFFLDQVNPAGGGNSFSNFASALGGAFAPHKALTAISDINDSDAAAVQEQVGGSGLGTDLGKLLAPITGLVFTGFSLIAIVITLLALVVMLTVRYVFIGILLILMPFAWLLWVFPNFKHHWDKWWHNFIRWSFFAPLVIFFLYIGIKTAEQISAKGGVQKFASYAPSNDGILAGILSFLSNLMLPIIQSVFDQLIVVAIMLGGLFAANSMGIVGASTFMGMAKSVGSGALGMVGRGAQRAATRPLRSEGKVAGWLGGKKLQQKLQERGSGMGRLLRTVTGARYVGRGMETLGVAGGEKLVGEAAGRTKNMTTSQKIHAFETASTPERIAWAEEIAKEGRLREVKDGEKHFGKDKKAEFARYNKEKLFDEVYDKSGLKIRDIQRDMAEANEAGKAAIFKGDSAKAGEAREKYTKAKKEHDKYFASAPNVDAMVDFLSADEEKIKKYGLPGGVKSTDELKKVQESIVEGIAKGFSASNLSSLFQKLTRGDQLDKFADIAKDLNLSIDDLSESNRNWLENSGLARNLGIGLKTFGVKGGRAGFPRREDE